MQIPRYARDDNPREDYRSLAPLGMTKCNEIYNFIFLKRSEFAITDTELKLIAAAARIGLSNNPKNGYSTPAAIGTPIEL